MAFKWTENEDSTLAKMWSEGAAVNAISDRLTEIYPRARTRYAVESRIKALGLPPRRKATSGRLWSPEEDEILLDGINSGRGPWSIAKSLHEAGYNRNSDSCINRAHRLGITLEGPDKVDYVAMDEAYCDAVRRAHPGRYAPLEAHL